MTPADNRPVYTLTVTEDNLRLTNLWKSIFPEIQSIEAVTPVVNPRIKINGIRGLATFLDVSIPTAQRIKNSKKFAFYASGNKVYFFSDEINAGLKVDTKVTKK